MLLALDVADEKLAMLFTPNAVGVEKALGKKVRDEFPEGDAKGSIALAGKEQ